jgi:uncharacterized protein YggT (Ycf19 family)
MSDFWSYWYFHIPNFVLAAVMYTLIGRLVLGFFAPENWDNYIWRAFKAITDPIVRLVRTITPGILGGPVVLVFSVLWVMMVRILWLVTLMRLDLAPAVQTV